MQVSWYHFYLTSTSQNYWDPLIIGWVCKTETGHNSACVLVLSRKILETLGSIQTSHIGMPLELFTLHTHVQ